MMWFIVLEVRRVKQEHVVLDQVSPPVTSDVVVLLEMNARDSCP